MENHLLQPPATRKLSYESALQLVGNFGRYQIFVVLWYNVCVCFLAAHFGYMSFAGAVPKVICKENETLFSNETCEKTTQFYSTVNEYQLDTPEKQHFKATASTVQMIGQAVGPLLAGQLSDRFGRKKAFLGFTLLLIAGGILSSLSVNFAMFIAFRFFVGLGTAALSSVHYVWYVEFMPEEFRLYSNIGSWGLGYIWLALLAYLAPTWRALGYLMNIPLIAALPMTIILRESPKWLLERGRTVDAMKSLCAISRLNRVDPDHLMRCQIQGPDPQLPTKSYTYWHLFHNRTSTSYTLALAFNWFVVAGVYYGLYYNISYIGGDLFINFLSVNVLFVIFSALTIVADKYWQWFGRKFSTNLSLGVSALCLAGIAICIGGSVQNSKWALIFFTLFGLSFGISRVYISMEPQCAEIFPTVLRNIGYGFCSVVARIGAVVCLQTFLLVDIWKPAPYIIYICLCLIAMVTTGCCLPETKNKPLPDLNHSDRLSAVKMAQADHQPDA